MDGRIFPFGKILILWVRNLNLFLWLVGSSKYLKMVREENLILWVAGSVKSAVSPPTILAHLSRRLTM